MEMKTYQLIELTSIFVQLGITASLKEKQRQKLFKFYIIVQQIVTISHIALHKLQLDNYH